jgi:hypothetical protein
MIVAKATVRTTAAVQVTLNIGIKDRPSTFQTLVQLQSNFSTTVV